MRVMRVWGLVGGLLAAPWATAGDLWREPVTGIGFVPLPKGCFQMGAPANAFREDEMDLHVRARQTEMPQHEVCLDSFWIAQFEVRESDWEKVMGTRHSTRPDDTPVGGVSWEQAVEFARRLTVLSAAGDRFRLPTEAEWEYACRGGVSASSDLPTRDKLDGRAWYSSSYDAAFSGVRVKQLQPVGTKAPNGFGLHDMLGNVWEWVQDAYRPNAYASHQLYNPSVVAPPETRVIRGGSLHTDRRMLRCEARGWLPATSTHGTVGLRLVRTLDGKGLN